MDGGHKYPSFHHDSTYLQSQGYIVQSLLLFNQSEDPEVSKTFIDTFQNKISSILPAEWKNCAHNHYWQYESLHHCGMLYHVARTNYAFAIRAQEDLGFQWDVWNGTTSNLTAVMTDLYQWLKTIFCLTTVPIVA